MADKHVKKIEYTVLSQAAQLSEPFRQLLTEAQKATKTAHAPYSHFCVGAALELEDGTIVPGSNQENASYPSGLCAERVAFFASGVQHPGKKIIRAAVVAMPAGKSETVPAAPCAACLQVMAEYEAKQQAPIGFLFVGAPGKYFLIDAIADFLPFSFDAHSLNL